MMDDLDVFVADSGNVGQSYSSGDKTYTIAKIDNFSYTDPVDASVSKNQVSLFTDTAIEKKNTLNIVNFV